MEKSHCDKILEELEQKIENKQKFFYDKFRNVELNYKELGNGGVIYEYINPQKFTIIKGTMNGDRYIFLGEKKKLILGHQVFDDLTIIHEIEHIFIPAKDQQKYILDKYDEFKRNII